MSRDWHNNPAVGDCEKAEQMLDQAEPFVPALPYGGRVAPNSGHAGSETSEAAAVEQDRSGATSAQQSRILGGIGLADSYGMTVGDVRRWTGWHHGTASRTLSDLHAAGLLARLTETRDRAKVYVLPEHVNGRETEPQGRTGTVQLLEDAVILLAEIAENLDHYHGDPVEACLRCRANDVIEHFNTRRH